MNIQLPLYYIIQLDFLFPIDNLTFYAYSMGKGNAGILIFMEYLFKLTENSFLEVSSFSPYLYILFVIRSPNLNFQTNKRTIFYIVIVVFSTNDAIVLFLLQALLLLGFEVEEAGKVHSDANLHSQVYEIY